MERNTLKGVHNANILRESENMVNQLEHTWTEDEEGDTFVPHGEIAVNDIVLEGVVTQE